MMQKSMSYCRDFSTRLIVEALCLDLWRLSASADLQRNNGLELNEDALAKRISLAVVGHIGPAPRGDKMSLPHALSALAALGQPMRLEIFRLLMKREPTGLPAGTIAESIGCPHNTLSTHLSILARSGLVQGTRDGRSIVYRANVDAHAKSDRISRHRLLRWSSRAVQSQDALGADACCAPAPKPSQRRKK